MCNKDDVAAGAALNGECKMVYSYETVILLDGQEIDVSVEYRADKPYDQTWDEPAYAGEVYPVSMRIGNVSVTGPLMDILFDNLDHEYMIDQAFGGR